MDSPGNLCIGVLSLQGAFARHLDVLRRLGVTGTEVRVAKDLEPLDGLIIPGGESTAMLKLLNTEAWLDLLQDFGRHKPVLGTCAGMVLMGTEIDDDRVTPFGWLPIKVLRNAYGSQVHSFRDVGTMKEIEGCPEVEMVFIRAPKFVPLSEEVTVIGTCRGEPVAARCGAHLATAFHPELTDDDRIHRLWLGLVAGTKRDPAVIRPQQRTT